MTSQGFKSAWIVFLALLYWFQAGDCAFNDRLFGVALFRGPRIPPSLQEKIFFRRRPGRTLQVVFRILGQTYSTTILRIEKHLGCLGTK